MKNILQTVLFNTLAIAGVSYLAPGVSYNDQIQVLLVAAVVLGLVNAFVKPFLKILLLPLNVITLGLMGWLTNVIILYLVTLLVAGFSVGPFTLTIFGTALVLSTFWAYVVVSFMLNIATTLISWVLK